VVIELDRICAICRTITSSEIVVKSFGKNILIDESIFSARRTPDKLTGEWRTCNSCELVRSSQNSDLNLDHLYSKSSFNYQSLVPLLSKTYMKIIKNTFNLQNLASVIEIGGGNGFMLDTLRAQGIKEFLEVEPSLEGFDAASPSVKNHFVKSMFDDSFSIDKKYDLLINFHVFDHVPDPLEFLYRCREFMNERGSLLIAVHNQKSYSAKILRNKSPIYDIEHTYLYSKKTLFKILQMAGYRNIVIRPYWNWITIEYLIFLLPISNKFKVFLEKTVLGAFLRKCFICLPLGNMYATAEL
jgi:SAM-dependent methyltransferase